MKVLMFGWEFPPHITGGLGTACAGIAKGLIGHQVTPLFVVPRLYGGEDQNKFRLVNASEIPVVPGSGGEWMKKLTYIEADADLEPYVSPVEFSQSVVTEKEQPGKITDAPAGTVRFQFSGGYHRDLLKEVYRYALIGAEIAKTHKHDIIHAHDWLTYPAGIAAREVSGMPFIAHVHATEFDRSGENINQQVYRIEKEGMLAADHIVAVSELTRQVIINRYGIPADKISVAHNGVAENDPAVSADHHRPAQKIVTFAGRITRQKGPEYFIRAAAKVLEKLPNVHFVMAGNGDLMHSMIRQAAALRISSRFHFTGFLQGPEIARLFSITDVFVMPSVSEPFGIVPLEAMQANVPVIISKQSGISEVVQHTVKIDFWDTDKMANAIHALLRFKGLAKSFSENGKAEAEALTWSRTARQIKKIYDTVLKQNSYK